MIPVFAPTLFMGGRAWTPAQLPDLLAWYKADAGVYSDAGTTLAVNNDPVRQWNDQSGHGYHYLQATSGNRPVYKSAGFNGSKPTLQFTASSSQYMVTDAGSGAATVAMGTGNQSSGAFVGQLAAATSAFSRVFSYAGTFLADQNASSMVWALRWSTDNTLDAYHGGRLGTQAISVDTPMRWLTVADGTNTITYLNDGAGSSTADNTAFVSPGTLGVGVSVGDFANFLDGMVSEIVITNGALSSGDRALLLSYFKTKWALPTFLLDSLSATSIVAYSSRRLRANHASAAFRIRRSSDNAEQDIGFDIAGELDTASMATFIGANSGLLRTAYNQSAASVNAGQSTLATQPVVVASGTNKTRNGHVCFQTTNATGNFVFFSTTQAQPLTIAMCFKLNSASAGIGSAHFTDGRGSTRPLFGTGAGPIYQLYAGSSAFTGGTPNTSTHTAFAIFNGASSELFIDGVSTVTGNIGTDGLGTGGGGQNYGAGQGDTALDCDYCEYIVFSGALSSGDMALIRASWQSYWGAP